MQSGLGGSMINFRPGLAALPTYSVPEREWDIKLDANECTSNLPPLVMERVINRLSFLEFNRYPDLEMIGLREQIAADFGIGVHNVLIGSGSSEILEKLFFALGGPGRSIVFPSPSFSMYGIYAMLSECEAVTVALDMEYQISREAVLTAAKQSNASMIVLCNPNNPTGTVTSPEDIEYIAANANCLVVVDEAYHEFYGESAVGLLEKYPNMAVARTFSKAYGLAAARVGYLLASAEVIKMVGKLMMPYHVSSLALATAEVVYQMRDEFAGRINQIVVERERMADALQAIPNVKVYPSAANFLLFQLAEAAGLSRHLAQENIGIRDFSETPGLENCLRVSIGTPLENDDLLQSINRYMKGRRS